ncbi:hypothetical protein TNCV_1861681 [Trichonephila clavipes]|nr:hypothetical protein TNCV_1861681 [Trichonephila clavipes]
MPPNTLRAHTDFYAEIVEVEIEVMSPSIVPSGNFAELNRTVTCMVLKANDRRTSCPCHDEFRGPRSDYVRQFPTCPNRLPGFRLSARIMNNDTIAGTPMPRRFECEINWPRPAVPMNAKLVGISDCKWVGDLKSKWRVGRSNVLTSENIVES